MTIQQLVYILEVYHYGSISNAAKELFISQPSLSLSIKELEKELGFVIFTRTNNGAKPTHDGLVFIKRCQDIVGQFKSIKDDYTQKQNSRSFLSVSATASSYSRLAFLEVCKRVSILDEFVLKFKSRELFEVIDDVVNKHFEMGIIIISQLQLKNCLLNFDELGLTYHPIRNVPVCYVMSKENYIVKNKKDMLEHLKEQTYVCFGDEERNKISYWSDYKSHFLSLLNYKKMVVLYDYDMIYSFVSQNNRSFAYGCFPHQGMIEKYNLYAILDESTPAYEMGYFVEKNKIITKEMWYFINELEIIIDSSNDLMNKF